MLRMSTVESTASLVDLSVVIPAYREAENLIFLLPQIHAACAALTPRYEVLVIDAPTDVDNTGEVCRANNAQHIHQEGGGQYGHAIRTAIAKSRGKYMLCMDADGSHSPSYYAAMWAKREQCDITIGSRYVSFGHTDNPAVLIWMSYIVNLVFRLAFSIHAKDVTTSFRLYRHDLLTSLHLESNDFDILEEILIKISILNPGVKICEIPITFEQRKAGESKRKLLQFALGYLNTLRRLKMFARHARQELANK